MADQTGKGKKVPAPVVKADEKRLPPHSPTPPPIMDINEVASYLRVSRSTIYNLLKKKAIPAFRVAGLWRFRLSSIDEWVEKLEQAEMAEKTAAKTPAKKKAAGKGRKRG